MESENFDTSRYKCDISVISPTLKHIDDSELFLKNIFKSTMIFAVLRTFISKESLEGYCLKPGASQSYLIRQFRFEDLKDKPFNLGWIYEVIRDKATESKEKKICHSIFRNQKTFIFKVELLKKYSVAIALVASAAMEIIGATDAEASIFATIQE